MKVNHFDRSKPFYPLVIHYVAQLIGFKELALRGLAGAESLQDLLRRVVSLMGASPDESQAEELRDGLAKLSGPLELRTESTGDHITVDVDDIARDVLANHAYLLSSTMLAAGSLLILAHEVSKDRPWHDTGPLWEFLRHCRNAAAHGGQFTFVRREPRRHAEWSGFTIDRSLQGTPLFKGIHNGGLISPGDHIRLLWDLEQAYPAMTGQHDDVAG